MTSPLVRSRGDGLIPISIFISIKEGGLSYVTPAMALGMEVVHADKVWQGGRGG